MAGPLTIPLIAGAVGAARALGPRMAPYWSRYGVPAVQGLQRWASTVPSRMNSYFRGPAFKRDLAETAKLAPATLGLDYLGYLAGRDIHPDVERAADLGGLALALASRNLPQAGVELGLMFGDPDYHNLAKRVGTKISNVLASSVQAKGTKVLAPIPKSSFTGLQTYNLPETIVNNAYRDPRDFTDRYNTPLTPQEEAEYRTWLNTVHPRQRNTRDYDLQGYYKAARDGIDPSRFKLAVDPEGNLHFDDRFKKPNHYTFSTDSMYSGRDGYYGGQWHELGNNKYSYTINPSNLYSNAELQDYFNRNEIGNILINQRGK